MSMDRFFNKILNINPPIFLTLDRKEPMRLFALRVSNQLYKIHGEIFFLITPIFLWLRYANGWFFGEFVLLRRDSFKKYN